MILKLPKSFLISFKDFYRDEGIFLSAALAFFSILSLIPLTMFVINVLFSITQEERIIRFIYFRLTNLFPNIEIQMIKDLKHILTAKGVSGISLFLYGFFSLQLFTAIEFSLNKIFKVSKKRHFFMSLFMSFFIILLIILAVAVSFTLSYTVRLFQPHVLEELGVVLRFFLKYIIPFFLVFVIIGMLYKILPNKKIKLVSIVTGSLITTVLIEIAKHIFAFYVLKVIKISTLYGSVSTFLALLMWLFYAWAVFLYGAEIIYNLEKKK